MGSSKRNDFEKSLNRKKKCHFVILLNYLIIIIIFINYIDTKVYVTNKEERKIKQNMCKAKKKMP